MTAEGRSPDDHADELFDRLSEALREHHDTRATKATLRAALAKADRAFDQLHLWLTAGNPLPEPWRKAQRALTERRARPAESGEV